MSYKEYKKIPNLLRRYRRSRGLRQTDVARILGMESHVCISRWEKGESMPSFVNVLKLSVLYRTMTDSLFIDLLRSLRDEIREQEEAYASREKNMPSETTKSSR